MPEGSTEVKDARTPDTEQTRGSSHCSAASEQALIAAMNLVCGFACDNLADGWSIELHLERGECSCELIDPDGETVHVDNDHDQSALTAMCNHSRSCDSDDAE